MGKNQNTSEKRRREVEKKRKAEEKRESRRKKKNQPKAPATYDSVAGDGEEDNAHD